MKKLVLELNVTNLTFKKILTSNLDFICEDLNLNPCKLNVMVDL